MILSYRTTLETYNEMLLQGQVTGVMFLESQPGVVLSCSKDTFVKVWDLSTQHCFKTMTGHLGEVGTLSQYGLAFSVIDCRCGRWCW